MITVGDFTLDCFQERALDALRKKWREGSKRCLMVGPTGSGKTVLALAMEMMCLENDSTVGFITSGRQLIFQKADAAQRGGLPFTVLMNESGYEYSATADLAIMSKDTLAARSKHILVRYPKLFIVDECDVALSPLWVTILEKATHVLGLTATPETASGHGLGGFYDSMVNIASYSELIESGRLVDIPEGKCFSPYRPHLKGVKAIGGEWNSASLSGRMNKVDLVGDIVEQWRLHGEDSPTVAFCVDKEHTASVCERFNAAGIRSEFIVDSTDTSERDDIFEETRNGQNKVICNCRVLTRGWDMPEIVCGIMAKPVKKRRGYLQMVGRLLRSNGVLKSYAILIDHSGNVWQHGWPTEDREWTLDSGDHQGDLQDEKASKAPEQFCKKCGALWKIGRDCPNPECDATRRQVLRGQPAEMTDGRLVKVTRKGVQDKKPAEQDPNKVWQSLLYAMARSNRTYNQAAAAFHGKMKMWPNHAGVRPLAHHHEGNMKLSILWPQYGRGGK